MTSGSPAATDLAALIRAGDEITDLLGTARSLEELAPELLTVLMGTRGWDGAFLLQHDSEAAVLRPVHARWRDGLRLGPQEAPHLHEPVPVQGTLAGSAVRTQQPIWREDVRLEVNRPRALALGALGVRSYIALPIVYGGIAYGLIELFSSRTTAEEQVYETWLIQVSKQLGQFVARTDAVHTAVRSRRTLEDLFNNAPVGIVILDTLGRVQRANQSTLAKLGYTREELVGRDWRDMHADPATADALLARVAQAGDKEITAPEVVLRARDGSRRWVHASVNARWEDGQLAQKRLFLRDMTEVRRAEASARESQERYRRLVEGASGYALHALDGEGRVTGWNPGAQRMFGWNESEVLGRDFTASFTAEDRADDVPGRLLRLAADEGRFRHEGWRVRKDGSRFPVEVLYTALRDTNGALLEVSQLTRDVTERARLDALRRRSAELEAANRDVLTGARDGVAVVRRIAEAVDGPLLSLEGLTRDTDVVPADAVDAGVRTLRGALRDLEVLGARALADPAHGAEGADAAAAAREAADLLAVPANERRVRLEQSLADDLPHVDLDSTRLRQLVYNLLAYGIRSSRERGVVRLIVQTEGEGHVRVQVEDNGIGHTDEELARLFDEKEALLADDTAAAALLPATRRIAELHGGRVGCHSTPGHGTVLFAVLPTVTARERLAAGGGGKDRRVLVVATEPWTRAQLCWTLGNAGFDVASADEPHRALVLASEDRCEVVAVDLRLDGMDPLDFVASLRSEGASRDTPCIIAGLGSRDVGVAGLLVADLVPRPVPADRIFAALERARVPRGSQAPVVVVDADATILRAAARSLELLGYRAAPEQDGHAALRAIAEERPAAVLLSPFVRGMDPFWFLHHLRRLPTAHEVPVFLSVPRGMTEEQLGALADGARQAAETGLWHQGLILESADRECPKAERTDAAPAPGPGG